MSSETGSAQRPPRQSRTGLTATGARKAAAKPPRTRAREFALQALYQHLVGRNDADSIDLFTRELAGFSKADAAHSQGLADAVLGLPRGAQRQGGSRAPCMG